MRPKRAWTSASRRSALATAASVRTLALIEVLFAQLIARLAFGQKTTAREAAGMLLVVCGGTRAVWKMHRYHEWKHEMEMKGMKPEQMKEMMKNCPMMKMMQEEKEEEAK